MIAGILERIPILKLIPDAWAGNPEPFYRFMAKWLTRFIYRPSYTGFEKIPKTGPALLIANHVSYLDGLIIAAGCDRPVRFVIDQDIYNWPGVNYFMKYNRAIPILPRRDSVEKMLAEVARGLQAGDAICIFPEGQLTHTGSLGRFRPGIEWILKRSPVNVYPIALTGLWGSIFSRKYRKSRFKMIPRNWFKPIRAICGDPIAPEGINVNMLQEIILRLKYSS